MSWLGLRRSARSYTCRFVAVHVLNQPSLQDNLDVQQGVKALRYQARALHDYKLPDFDIPGSTKWVYGCLNTGDDPKGTTDRRS